MPLDLIKAIDENTIDSLLSWSKWSKIEVHTDGDTIWTVSGIPFFLFNLVLPIGPSSAGPGEVIDAAARGRSIGDSNLT